MPRTHVEGRLRPIRTSNTRSRAEDPLASTICSRAEDPLASTICSRADDPRASTLPSFRTLFHDHVGFVWRVLQRDGVAERELEDACEEVFLTAIRELVDAPAHPSVRAWIGGIAARVAATPRAQGIRERELLRPLSPDAYEPDSRPPRKPKRARMFASGPSVEARARMLAQLEGALGEEHVSQFPEAPSGVARLWVLRLALGLSVLLGGAMLQLQNGCGHRERDGTARARTALAHAAPAAPTDLTLQTAGSPEGTASARLSDR